MPNEPKDVYPNAYSSVVKHLARLVDYRMIEDTKEGYAHGSSATYDICRAEVDHFIRVFEQDTESVTDELYDYYYDEYTKPHLSKKEG